MKITNHLKFYRQQKEGLTQAKLAQMVGLGERHYQNIEYGSTKPNVEIALLLAEALQVKVEDLFKISQRQLRETSPFETTYRNDSTDGRDMAMEQSTV